MAEIAPEFHCLHSNNRFMRHIGNLPTEEQARLFGNYLFAKGIRNEIEDEGHYWMIWVADEEQLDLAAGTLEQFRANPTAPEYSRVAAEADRLRAEEAKANEAYRKRFRTRKQLFRGAATYRSGMLTWALMMVCVLVFIRSDQGRDQAWVSNWFISKPENYFGAFLPEVRHGEVWRLFTPMFLHFGWRHLIFNMLWLFQLGSMIEQLQGQWRFALLVAILAITSNLAQYAIPPFKLVKYVGMVHYSNFGGMSGVDYGLFGYIWLRGKFDPGSGLFIDQQTLIIGLVCLVAGFTGYMGPIANMCHGAGLLVGAAYGYVTAMIAQRWGTK